MSLRSKTAEDQFHELDFEGSRYRGLGAWTASPLIWARWSKIAKNQSTSSDFEGCDYGSARKSGP